MKQKPINLSGITGITRGRLDRREVFADFAELFAMRISNRVDPVHFKTRYEQALILNEKYSESEHEQMDLYMQEIAHQIQGEVEVGKVSDILGRIFEENRFTRSGQDQTPSDLAKLLGQLTFCERSTIPEKGYFELDEPTCRALVLGAAEVMLSKGMNYCEHLVVRATDLDLRCVHMAYTQLSLYGIPAVVIHGNTLTLQEYSRWYTPMYILGKWVWRWPVSLDGTRSPTDELLKRISEPIYGAIRQIEAL